MGKKLIDLTGKRFGEWTVLYRNPENYSAPSYDPMWVCRCDCGAVAVVHGGNLRYGKSTCCQKCRDGKLVDSARAYYRAKAMRKGAADVCG